MTPEIHVAANEHADASGKRWSLWAIAALICGCIVVPPMPFLAPVLGLWAIISIQRQPSRRGTGLAAIGIVLGLAVSSAWIALVVGIRGPLVNGPTQPLRTGLTGDIAGFKAAMGGPAAEAPDDEAEEFLLSLRTRYGNFITCTTDEFRSPDPEHGPWDEDGMRIPYKLVFDQTEVDVVVRATLINMGIQFTAIQVIDPALGDLYYPSAFEFADTQPEPMTESDPPPDTREDARGGDSESGD